MLKYDFVKLSKKETCSHVSHSRDSFSAIFDI